MWRFGRAMRPGPAGPATERDALRGTIQLRWVMGAAVRSSVARWSSSSSFVRSDSSVFSSFLAFLSPASSLLGAFPIAITPPIPLISSGWPGGPIREARTAGIHPAKNATSSRTPARAGSGAPRTSRPDRGFHRCADPDLPHARLLDARLTAFPDPRQRDVLALAQRYHRLHRPAAPPRAAARAAALPATSVPIGAVPARPSPPPGDASGCGVGAGTSGG
jgi:hypothetical protein